MKIIMNIHIQFHGNPAIIVVFDVLGTKLTN